MRLSTFSLFGVLIITVESSFDFTFTGGASFVSGEDDSALQISDDILFWLLLLALIFFSRSRSLPEHACRVRLLSIEMEANGVILIDLICVALLEETAYRAVVVLLVPVVGI